MFLSRISLNLYNRSTMKALNSPSIFHGAIENSFVGERKRNLWRIDRLQNNYYILILSETIPDFSAFCTQFEPNSVETKSYDKLLEKIKYGDKWHFRITANPTKAVKKYAQNNHNRGKILPHITIEFQKKWLIEKSLKNGFLLSDNSFDVVQNSWKHFYKKGSRRVSILSVTYEGVLTISNEELFKKALVMGIGRGKAYGMGLMTIIK